MPRKKKEFNRRPDKCTIESAPGVIVGPPGEWKDFKTYRVYFISRKFKIKALRGCYITLLKRISETKYLARLGSKGKEGWRIGDVIKITKNHIKTSFKGDKHKFFYEKRKKK